MIHLIKTVFGYPAGSKVFHILRTVGILRVIISILEVIPGISLFMRYLENLSFGRGFCAFISLNSFGNGLVAGINLLTTPNLNKIPAHCLHYNGNVTVLIPARNEENRLPNLINGLREQVGLPNLHVLIVNDNSTDATEKITLDMTQSDPRFEILTVHTPPNDGWLGKSAALEAGRIHLEKNPRDPGILLLIDADVKVEPEALVRSVIAYLESDAELVTIWPHQEAQGIRENLFQPMFTWMWIGWAPRFVSTKFMPKIPIMTVTMGQFIVIDWEIYQAVGGHYAVRSNPLEDLYFGRSLRKKGYKTDAFFPGKYVTCRMYESWQEIRDGYTRWLHVFLKKYQLLFFGPALIFLSFLAPSWMFFPRIRGYGIFAYCSVVASRIFVNIASDNTRNKMQFISALMHPFTALGTMYLIIRSHWLAHKNQIVWKDRIISDSGSFDLSDKQALSQK